MTYGMKFLGGSISTSNEKHNSLPSFVKLGEISNLPPGTVIPTAGEEPHVTPSGSVGACF